MFLVNSNFRSSLDSSADLIKSKKDSESIFNLCSFRILDISLCFSLGIEKLTFFSETFSFFSKLLNNPVFESYLKLVIS